MRASLELQRRIVDGRGLVSGHMVAVLDSRAFLQDISQTVVHLCHLCSFFRLYDEHLRHDKVEKVVHCLGAEKRGV